MEPNNARKRAKISGKATNILDSRTLTSSHKRLIELLSEGLTVLDVGCGTGAITRGIAEVVGDKGRVIGIDYDPELIGRARQRYSDVPWLSFETGDVYNLHYKDEFDIVTSARVLQWLNDPLKALHMMKSATKCGGRLLVLDYNHEKICWEPAPPSSVEDFYVAFLKWRSEVGMDNAIVDRLPNMFKQIDLQDIIITPQHEVVDRTDTNFRSQLGIWENVIASRGVQMVKGGVIQEADRAIAEQDCRKWIDEKSQFQSMYLLAVEGVKNH